MNLIYPAAAEPALLHAAKKAQKRLQEALGKTLPLLSDAVAEPRPGDILLGNTRFPESEALASGLRYYDWARKTVNRLVVVTGGYPGATVQAIDALGAEGCRTRRELSAPACAGYPYRFTQCTLNGLPLEQYRVVWPAAMGTLGELLAKSLNARLCRLWGRRLELVSDAEPPRAPELLLGLTNRTPRTVKDPIAQHDDGVLLSHPFGVQLWGSSPSGVSQAIRAFLSLLEQAPQSGGNACVELPGKLLSRPDDVLRVFSQNILYNEIRPDRASRLLQTVMNEAPDVFGIQEGVERWLPHLLPVWHGMYESVGDEAYIAANSNEFVTLFYNRCRFYLLEGGTRWLSDTPDVPNTKYEQSSLVRIFSYAVLKRREDGKVFLYANTHFDHCGGQDRQALKLAELLDGISHRWGDCPVFATGDYNQYDTWPSYKNLISCGYTDAGKAAAVRENARKTVFTQLFERLQPAADPTEHTIDYCFTKYVPAEDILLYRVETDLIDGDDPSDHYGVYFEFRLRK